MIALCLGMAGSVWATLPLQSFTLAWQHTVEKVLWEEDYRLSERGLLLEEARVRGSGAGMEIPEGAVLRDGAWHYHRGVPPLQPLRLGRRPEAGDYRICRQGRCDALARWIGPPDPERPAVELWACPIRDPSD
ncbi:DUF1850 domain-containing protein [Pseudomonas aeruginosa]|uniref:DUF1850 domain-containing protein n=1 Tax=Pseudomonas aeruginosa TaxID=287 RepID=UPI003CF5C2D0